MTDNVVPLRFNVEEVGKHVKSSKKRFTWQVSLNGKQHAIVLDFSFISGKVKVTVDRKILIQNQLPANTSFQYPFTLDGNSLNVIQQGETFELRINNKVFSHLYNQAKTNKQFKKYEDEVKDFKVNENQFQAKKLTLNIGGVGGGMKKKPKAESTEGHTWNAFGGDEMTGFPNYFEAQSESTTEFTQKIEQAPQRKVSNDLLGGDSDIPVTKSQDSNPQNILDFEAEIQNTSYQTSTGPKPQDDFSTMQLMFQSMNLMGQQTKQQVVIDNSEVDFFSSEQDKKPQKPTVQQPQIDFFADVGLGSVPSNTQSQSINQPPENFNTMRNMFATSNIQPINQVNFTTSNLPKQQNQNPQLDWGLIPQTSQQNQLPNFNTTNNQTPNQSNFSTLQGLFATNAMRINQSPPSTIGQQPVQATQKQQNDQGNFSLNTQHFATQQIPTQNFGTSFNLNTQAFGTQSLMGQGLESQKVNFLGQNPISQPSAQQSIIQQPVSQPEINQNDFNSMQMLFKTNMSPVQQNIKPVQQGPVAQKQSQFIQQFATVGGSSNQSPNTMFMNSYTGSNNPNLSFEMSMNTSQQFSTWVSPSMMKKKAPQTNLTSTQAANSLGDLI